jgi:hypothetical protein
MSFVIMSNIEYDVLLGLDWFRLSKAGIFPVTREFPHEIKQIDTEHELAFLTEEIDD